MCSRFLVSLLVGLLLSLSLGCVAPVHTPTPDYTPAPIRITAPAAVPPVEDKVEVKFDRFKNQTTVNFPSVKRLVARADSHLTPEWFASFAGQTPSTIPSILSLTFWKYNKTWQYLRCHSLAILADGASVQLPPAKHDGDVRQGYVSERITVIVSLATARKLSESHLVEFKVCNTEGRFSEGDLQGLRDVIKAITLQ
jgi:hypothetical protein